MTVLQHDPSAHAPWTSTIFGLSLTRPISSRAIVLRVEIVRLSQPTLFERRPQLRPIADVKFGEDATQMPTNGSVREEQALADFTVRKPLRDELDDLQLLASQAIAGFRCPLANRHA